MTDNTAALQAELQRLEEELEKKRLQEQIQALESQLVVEQQQQEEAQATGYHQEEYYDDEEEYEEIIEEYVEEVTENDEEVCEEIFEEEVIESPEPVKKGRVSHSGGGGGATAAPVTSAPAPAPAPPPARRTAAAPTTTKLRGSNNPFTKALADKKAAAAQADQEKASRAAAAASAANASTGGGGGTIDDGGGPLPPLPSFTPRVIPKDIPASPSGQETAMEVLIGPKLYSQGKLISRSTVAGCTGMDLILLYFGAGWKKDCKVFFPLLLDFYTITTSAAIAGNENTKLECVYVPQDRNLNEFKSFFATTPFLSMATRTSALKNMMAKSLYITDVPTVIVVDASTGHVVSTQGVAEIQRLQRRDVEQCQALVRKWKATTPVPICDAEKAGIVRRDDEKLQRGILYWQE